MWDVIPHAIIKMKYISLQRQMQELHIIKCVVELPKYINQKTNFSLGP